MAFLGIKSASDRVKEWAKVNRFLPGCDGSLTSNCSFPGTSADWEAFRRDSIDNCTAQNSGGFLQSKNKARAQCQSAFDAQTMDVRFAFAEQNSQDKALIQSLIGTDNPMSYVLIFLFVGLIVYLLFSK